MSQEQQSDQEGHGKGHEKRVFNPDNRLTLGRMHVYHMMRGWSKSAVAERLQRIRLWEAAKAADDALKADPQNTEKQAARQAAVEAFEQFVNSKSHSIAAATQKQRSDTKALLGGNDNEQR